MTRLNNQPQTTQDDQLADFTDRILQGQIDTSLASQADDELVGLKKTVLRLNSSFPPATLDDADIKQMQVRLNARIKRESKNIQPSLWQKWINALSQPGPRFGMAAIAIAVIAAIAVLTTTPSTTADSSTTTATAMTSSQGVTVVAIILVGVIFIIFWSNRNK